MTTYVLKACGRPFRHAMLLLCACFFGCTSHMKPLAVKSAAVLPGHAPASLSQTRARLPELFDAQGRPTQPLRELLRLGGAEPAAVGRLPQVNAWMQEHWLRPGDVERWGPKFEAWAAKVEEGFSDKIERAWHVLQQVGYGTEISPRRESYDAAVLLGATATAMTNRLGAMEVFHQRGVRFGEVVLLGTTLRPRSDQKEPERILARLYQTDFKEFLHPSYRPLVTGLSGNPAWRLPDVLPSNEAEILDVLYGRFAWSWTRGQSGSVGVVRLGRMEEEVGREGLLLMRGPGGRANTADTIHTWLISQDEPRKNSAVLLISGSPAARRQLLVARQQARQDGRQDLILDVAALTPRESMRLAVALDELAREVYTIYSDS